MPSLAQKMDGGVDGEPRLDQCIVRSNRLERRFIPPTGSEPSGVVHPLIDSFYLVVA
jgi:hypothetical protein